MGIQSTHTFSAFWSLNWFYWENYISGVVACHLIYTGVLAGMDAYRECQENYKRSRVLKFRND